MFVDCRVGTGVLTGFTSTKFAEKAAGLSLPRTEAATTYAYDSPKATVPFSGMGN